MAGCPERPAHVTNPSKDATLPDKVTASSKTDRMPAVDAKAASNGGAAYPATRPHANGTAASAPRPSSADSVAAMRCIQALRQQLGKALLGKPEAIDFLITALLARGHVLIEDLPGLGKTTLARALAKSVSGTFARIQFTPDLLPSDILGTSVYHQSNGEFTWRAGPVFSNILLADEINRATPRTQAALLEAMSEGCVSFDGVTRALPSPFIVVATQNPLEHAGTYPLPESQLDRFALRIAIGYPDRAEELAMLSRFSAEDAAGGLGAVATLSDIINAQEAAKSVRVDESLAAYILAIVAETRKHPKLLAGASPRGSLALYRCAQAYALVQSRAHVTPDDVKALAVPVLAHRVLERASFERGNGIAGAASAAESPVAKIVARVEVPV